MAAAKQQEEKRVQFLRRMVALPHNRHCFDCGQRGPTYVNMTIGSYVCTACSGILRGINPPHRVKSVSMASFTQEEVDLLTQRGNEYNKQVWLGLHDTKEPPAMDTNDEIKLRDYLTQKYEKKRWYQAPTDGLAEAAKVMNNQTAQQQSGSSSAIRRPVGGLGGGFKIQTGTTSAPTTSSLPKTIAPPAVTAVSVPAAEPHKPLSAKNSDATSAELLSDVFGSKPAQDGKSAESDFNQPNFANFSGTQVAPPASNSLLATAGATPASSSQPNQWSANPPAQTGGDNKYASLTGLFSDTTEVAAPVANPGTAAGGVNWNAINWSGGAGQPAGSVPALSSSPASGMNWGTSATPAQPAAPSGNVFGAAPQATSTAGWSAGAPTTGVNPFMAAPAQSAFGAAQPQQPAAFGAAQPQQPAAFGAAQPQQPAAFGGYQAANPPGMAPTTLSTGFGAQPAATFATQPTQMFAAPASTQMNAGFNTYGQQPAANGQFGGATAMPNGTGSQWGAAPAGNQWGAAPAQQWGAVSKQPTSVNPFLTQSQAPPVQQQSMATNPFL